MKAEPNAKRRKASRDDISSIPVSGIEDVTFFHLCSAFDTPRSLTAWLLWKNKEYGQLVGLAVDPFNYRESDVEKFFFDSIVSSFFSKYRDFDVGIDREAVAFQKWKSAEESCRDTNELLRMTRDGNVSLLPFVAEGLSFCRGKISEILGENPPLIVKKDDEVVWSIAQKCRFGPGADLSTHRDNTGAYHKYADPGTVTPWVLPILEDILDDDHRLDLVHRAELVASNRLSFVPKNAKTDRAICVEPRWNIFTQLGVGQVISDRLKTWGVDLKDQNPNRSSARRALEDGLVTVDLSSASDTVAKGLVLELLPDAWSDLLFKSRSPYTTYRGERFQLEKVSSMGNGYTFPLESLIFFSACLYACKSSGADESEIRVFGDDLIVPKKAARNLVDFLNAIGFSVNSDKSCFEGLFYESCGVDYFNGRNVRPIFLKERVTCVERAIRLVNQIVDLARRSLGYDGFDRRFWPAYCAIVKRIPRGYRLYGPVDIAGVIHASFDTCRPTPASHGWEGYMVKAFVAIPKETREYDYYGHLYSKISEQVSDTQERVIARGSVRWKRKVVYTHKYTDFLLK